MTYNKKKKVMKKSKQKVKEAQETIDAIAYSIQNPIENGIFTDHRLNPWKKLFTGLFMFSTSVYFIYFIATNRNMHKMEVFLREAVFSFLPKSLCNISTSLTCMFLAGLALVWFVRGLYRIGTFNMYNVTFDEAAPINFREFIEAIKDLGGEANNGDLSKINSLISYRNSVMCGMSPAQAAEFMTRTSVLDAAVTGVYGGSRSATAISYLNSKLSSFTPQGGLDYIAGKK